MSKTLVYVDQSTVERLVVLQKFKGEPFELVIARIAKEATMPRGPTEPQEERTRYQSDGSGKICVTLLGEQFAVSSYREALSSTLRRLQALDSHFLPKLSGYAGRTRRIVARTPDAIYPGRPDLAQKYTEQLCDGWWVGTNNSWRDVKRMLQVACAVTGLGYGAELRVETRPSPVDDTGGINPRDSVSRSAAIASNDHVGIR